MKGPGMRLDLDVRRQWECPRCGRSIKRDGDVVALRCHCDQGGTWMKVTGQPPTGRSIEASLVRTAFSGHDEVTETADSPGS